MFPSKDYTLVICVLKSNLAQQALNSDNKLVLWLPARATFWLVAVV